MLGSTRDGSGEGGGKCCLGIWISAIVCKWSVGKPGRDRKVVLVADIPIDLNKEYILGDTKDTMQVMKMKVITENDEQGISDMEGVRQKMM